MSSYTQSTQETEDLPYQFPDQPKDNAATPDKLEQRKLYTEADLYLRTIEQRNLAPCWIYVNFQSDIEMSKMQVENLFGRTELARKFYGEQHCVLVQDFDRGIYTEYENGQISPLKHLATLGKHTMKK